MYLPDREDCCWVLTRRLQRTGRLPCHAVAALTFLVMLGCTQVPDSTSVKSKTSLAVPAKIVAQGQILPAEGLIRLAATPGDIVEQIDVKVGDNVSLKQRLITMRSLKLHESRVDALKSRYEDAKQQQASAIEQAQLRVSAMELKLQQADAQIKALGRQEAILTIAKNQVSASEKVLQQLEAVADDPLTSDFVGTMQLEQQRIAIGDAELKYRQQAESFSQAKDAASLGEAVAHQELKAARSALQAAEKSLALAAIDAELATLELQKQSAFVTAPQDAVVVAVNTRVGEIAGQFPLIELADLSKTICAAEVVETDAALVEPNQIVKITSPALPHELKGKVLKRERLVGRPQLALADPLAKSDYRSVSVTIEIDAEDIPIASKWLQLQVNVEIAVAPQP